jgi:hypothetical protein
MSFAWIPWLKQELEGRRSRGHGWIYVLVFFLGLVAGIVFF